MAIARLPLIVIGCPDPGALARFYGAMLDWKIDVSADRASVCAEDGQCTEPATPRHNGKVERYHRILADEFLYAHAWTSEQHRTEALQV